MLLIYYSRASLANVNSTLAALWDSAAPTSACSDIEQGNRIWVQDSGERSLTALHWPGGPFDKVLFISQCSGALRAVARRSLDDKRGPSAPHSGHDHDPVVGACCIMLVF